MIVGVDLDNTLIRWDTAFATVGRRAGVPASVPATKADIKAYFIDHDREDEWTLLQGEVYGNAADEAVPYPGARDALQQLRAAGHALVLVSHKTRQPHRGPPYDLRQAARDWLSAHAFVGPDVLDEDRLFFESTREDKLARITALGCEAFVDDLPGVLTAPGFPVGARGVLFDPDARHTSFSGPRAASWTTVPELVLRHG